MKKRKLSSLPEYSYRQSLKKEEIKVYRRIALILTAVFVILAILWFMGTTFLGALGTLSNGNNDETQTTTDESLPLLAPKLEKLPEATNTSEITVAGVTTSGVEVILFVNDAEIGKTKADTTGSFTFSAVALKNGLNLIKVAVSDGSGGQEETSATVTLDKTKPSLAISNPVDKASYPNTTTTLVVSGITEAKAIVYVNSSQAVVDANGKFSYNLSVSAGENEIEANAIDAAGNSTTVRIKVTIGP